MKRDELPNLEIRISLAGPGRYAVEMQVGEREFPRGTLGQEVLSSGEEGAAAEGARLFAALVADVGLRSAWDQAAALHPRRRIRLRIDDAAPELHTLAWETLHDPSPAAAVRSLAADLDTPFSRYVACPWEPLGTVAGPIKVLTAIAAPGELERYGLAPIDRAGEEKILADAFALAPAGLVQRTALRGPCTLAALAAELERGYHVLHLVAHGAVNSDRSGGVVFLERADGGVERVDVDRFARTIDCLSRSLRLVVLMSCNTATRSPTDPRFGFAPALLAAGVPAVLAMQDRMPMPTAAAFTRAFYEELWHSGQIDRAANRARRVVVTEKLPGNAVPALYATRMSLRLWDPAESSGHVAEDRAKKPAESAAAEAGDEPDAPAPAPAPAPKSKSDGTWEEFGGPFLDLHVARGPGGCVSVFARDDGGSLRHRRQLAPGGAWSEWELAGTNIAAVAVAADPRGRLTTFTLGFKGLIHFRTLEVAGKWTPWNDDLGGPVELITAACRKDGSLVLVAQVGEKLRIFEQRRPGGLWAEPYEIAGGFASMALVRNATDHLRLFGIEPDGSLSTTVQWRPLDEWDEWDELLDDITGIATVIGSDNCLYLAAVDAEHEVRWTNEKKPGGAWHEWEQVSSDCGELAAVWPRGGRLVVYALDTGGAPWKQVWREDDTASWERLGSRPFAALRAVEADGRTEVFALDEAGKLFRLLRS